MPRMLGRAGRARNSEWPGFCVEEAEFWQAARSPLHIRLHVPWLDWTRYLDPL
jgi:pyridoxine/pyridoxamine 5'-phosphate oxidase